MTWERNKAKDISKCLSCEMSNMLANCNVSLFNFAYMFQYLDTLTWYTDTSIAGWVKHSA